MVEEDLDGENDKITEVVGSVEEKDTVDKSKEEVKADSDEEVEAGSKETGTDNYKDYEKMSDKEKVKYGF